jgi:Acyltransferase family
MQVPASTSSTATRLHGFDYLKTIVCLFVVALHASPFGSHSIAFKFITKFIFLSGVPCFFLMSLVILDSKLETQNKAYLFKRVSKLFQLYLIWLLLPLFFGILYPDVFIEQVGAIKFDASFFNIFLNGLPVGLSTVGIWFIADLIVLTIACYFFKKIEKRSVIFTLSATFFLIDIAAPFLPEIFDDLRNQGKPLSILLLLVYVPISRLIAFDLKHQKEKLRSRILLFSSLALFSILLESAIQYLNQRFSTIPFHSSLYGRISVVLIGTCLTYLFLESGDTLKELTNQHARYISFLFKPFSMIGNLCLPIYLIQGYAIGYLSVKHIREGLHPTLFFAIVLIFSCSISSLIIKIPKLRAVLLPV